MEMSAGLKKVKNGVIFGMLFCLIALFVVPRVFDGELNLTPGDAPTLLQGDERPNWVSANAESEAHRVEIWEIKPHFSMEHLKTALEGMPRTKVVKADDSYIHAEYRSFILGYCLDIEILWEHGGNDLVYKSKARLLYHDFGMGRKRYAAIAQRLVEGDLIYGE